MENSTFSGDLDAFDDTPSTKIGSTFSFKPPTMKAKGQYKFFSLSFSQERLDELFQEVAEHFQLNEDQRTVVQHCLQWFQTEGSTGEGAAECRKNPIVLVRYLSRYRKRFGIENT